MTKSEAIQSTLNGNKITNSNYSNTLYYFWFDKDSGCFKNHEGNNIEINQRIEKVGYTLWSKPVEYVCFPRAWKHMIKGNKARLKSTNKICFLKKGSLYTTEEINLYTNIRVIDGEWELL